MALSGPPSSVPKTGRHWALASLLSGCSRGPRRLCPGRARPSQAPQRTEWRGLCSGGDTGSFWPGSQMPPEPALLPRMVTGMGDTLAILVSSVGTVNKTHFI